MTLGSTVNEKVGKRETEKTVISNVINSIMSITRAQFCRRPSGEACGAPQNYPLKVTDAGAFTRDSASHGWAAAALSSLDDLAGKELAT